MFMIMKHQSKYWSVQYSFRPLLRPCRRLRIPSWACWQSTIYVFLCSRSTRGSSYITKYPSAAVRRHSTSHGPPTGMVSVTWQCTPTTGSAMKSYTDWSAMETTSSKWRWEIGIEGNGRQNIYTRIRRLRLFQNCNWPVTRSLQTVDVSENCFKQKLLATNNE